MLIRIGNRKRGYNLMVAIYIRIVLLIDTSESKQITATVMKKMRLGLWIQNFIILDI